MAVARVVILHVHGVDEAPPLDVDNNPRILELQLPELRHEAEDGEVEAERHEPLRDRADDVEAPAPVPGPPLGGIVPVEAGARHLAADEHHHEGGAVEGAGEHAAGEQEAGGVDRVQPQREVDQAPQPQHPAAATSTPPTASTSSSSSSASS